MADWTNVTDSQVDPDAPITSELGYAFRDNPIAIAEGAAGAPRVEDAALSSTVTPAGRTWVGERMSSGGIANLGSFIFATRVAGGSPEINPGDIVPSGELRYSSSEDANQIPGPGSGQWRCHGYIASGSSGATLFQRVS